MSIPVGYWYFLLFLCVMVRDDTVFFCGGYGLCICGFLFLVVADFAAKDRGKIGVPWTESGNGGVRRGGGVCGVCLAFLF